MSRGATGPLAGVEPRLFWEHFEAITRIARPSRHEGAIVEHVRAWAAAHGLDPRQDAGGNLVIPVPATPGRESAPTVILQGHLDMVCEHDPASPNDAAAGRIDGWRPALGSPALSVASTVYERLFGEPPMVTAAHVGLEPAVIGGKLPGLDMLSLGPQIEFPHSPDERVGLPSVERFWRLLVAVLDELSAPAGDADVERGSQP